ncbi:type I toxin-antitoxin system Ibs family toxin [Leminorella grimontii]|nr:type I toxin-antitoxin system Ibs family toxin [Leminorella grimontii]
MMRLVIIVVLLVISLPAN